MKKAATASLLFSICAALLLASSALSQSDQPETASFGNFFQKTATSAQPVLGFADQSLVRRAGSTLVRTSEGAYMSLHSFDLIPGNAYSTWWVFFNRPRECGSRPCSLSDLENPAAQPSVVNATGRVVGPGGTADFGAFIRKGDTEGAVFGPGLLDPMKAEIHLVVRTHGPAAVDDPQRLREQLTTFNGGCPPNTCEDLQISIHRP
jgi:hypothetical protein